MKSRLATIVATVVVTTAFNYKLSVWRVDKASASFKESAANIGSVMYVLGKTHGHLEAQREMVKHRPVVGSTKFVAHTMN